MKKENDGNSILKVLCLEDSPRDAEIVHELLIDAGYDLNMDSTDQEEEFVSFLRNRKYDIILSDFKLPGFDAFTALKLSKSICPDIPFIVVSGSIGEEIAIELLKQGAVDYVLKDRMGRLSFAVQRALKEAKEKESLRQAEIQKEAAQKALSESEHRYHTLADNSPVGIFHTRADGYTTYVNPRWCEISKFSTEAALGFGWLNAVHPDDRNSLNRGWMDSTNALRSSTAEYRFLRPDGTIAWVMGQAVPEIDSENNIVGYVGTITDITKRKHAEELLEESQLKLVEAQHIGKIGNWEWIPAEDKVTWSAEMYNIFGVEPGIPLNSEKSIQLFHPDDRDYVRESTRRSIENREPYPIECRIIKPDGELRWVTGRGEIIRDSDGQIVKMVGIYQDITERKLAALAKEKAEKELLINEERLNLALEATSDAIWDQNFSTSEIYLSPRYYEILGYTKSEFPSSFYGWKKLIHPDDIESVNKVLVNSNENVRDNYEMEFRMRTKNNEWKWISNHFKVVERDNKGKSVRLIGTISDITERKLSEIELRRINRALKMLSICNGMLVKSKNETELLENICRIITEIGDYRMAWIGFAEQNEFKTVKPVTWAGNETGFLRIANITWTDNERGMGPVGEVIRSGKPVIIPDIRSDQSFMPWLIEAIKRGYSSTISLPLIENESVFGSLTIYSGELNAFDSNELQLLSELANDLAYGIISIRTREKHSDLQNQLLQSQKMEAIGRLAGGIAHDFNNILTVILGNADLLLSDKNRDETSKKTLELIKSSAKKAASLTHQLLAFSRKQMIQPKELDLNMIVKDAQKMLVRMIGEDIVLAIVPGNNLKKIKADHGQIDQIIMNLVVNAKDSMPQGGELVIKTQNIVFHHSDTIDHPDRKTGQFVRLQISDTGTGMTDEVMSQIFEPFFTTKEFGKGTGLGLSVVYGIVKQNEGWIEIESEIGTGTTFNIYMPAIDVSGEDIQLSEDLNEKYHGNNETILILEDDNEIRDLVSDTLIRSGYKIRQAKNIKEAREILNQPVPEFDLVYFDIVLPDGSGIEFYEEIHLSHPNLKVLFSSGYADEKARWSIIQEKQYDFIQKPYETVDLLKAIKEKINS